MFVVETVRTQRYISGIFTDKDKADQCLSMNPTNRVIRSPAVKFPFYIIEEPRQAGNFFRYVNQSQILRVLRNIVRVKDDEHTYLNLYYVCSEFKPRKPLADEMERLSHYHINNTWLNRFAQCGEVLIAEMT